MDEMVKDEKKWDSWVDVHKAAGGKWGNVPVSRSIHDEKQAPMRIASKTTFTVTVWSGGAHEAHLRSVEREAVRDFTDAFRGARPDMELVDVNHQTFKTPEEAEAEYEKDKKEASMWLHGRTGLSPMEVDPIEHVLRYDGKSSKPFMAIAKKLEDGTTVLERQYPKA